MKRRFGYVSNSSSSSFVVVPDSVVEEFNSGYEKHLMESYECLRTTMEFSHIGKGWCGLFADAQTRFSWEQVLYHGLKDKWNWLVLQAFYGGQRWLDKMDALVEEATNGEMAIAWDIVESMDDGGRAFVYHLLVDAKSTFDEVEKVGIARWLADERCSFKID